MSIPTSKMLSTSKTLGVSKGIMTVAKLKHSSPNQSQNVCVNIGLQPEKNKEEQEEVNESVNASYTENPNPYDNIPKERSLQSAAITIEDLSKILVEKENICRALLLILDIVENNPLKINKYIIADSETLRELVLLLTNSDEVSIQTDLDLGCGCYSDKFTNIDKIFVKKNNETYNLKYSFPDAIKILDDHRISTKICV